MEYTHTHWTECSGLIRKYRGKTILKTNLFTKNLYRYTVKIQFESSLDTIIIYFTICSYSIVICVSGAANAILYTCTSSPLSFSSTSCRLIAIHTLLPAPNVILPWISLSVACAIDALDTQKTIKKDIANSDFITQC